MSRSNNVELINSAQRFYEWQGSTGKLKYFDKSKGEKGENVLVNLPFTFLVLDRLSSIKGFSDADQSGFWSNEIRDIKKDTLTVRTKKGIVATGLYSTLAPILNQGAQFNQSVYIAVKEEKKITICNIAMTGSAIGAWIDLCKGKNIYKYAITITSAKPMKKGATNYFIPVFKLNPNISEDTEGQCVLLDKHLQEYLTAYFARNKSEQQENVSPADVISDRQRNDIADLKQEDLTEINTKLNEDGYEDFNNDEQAPF